MLKIQELVSIMEYRTVPPRSKSVEHIDNRSWDVNTHYNPIFNCLYLEVPKNASRAMLNWLGHPPMKKPTNPEPLILWVIRNPITRIVSSFMQVWKLYKLNTVWESWKGKNGDPMMTNEEIKYNLKWRDKKYSLAQSFNIFLDSLKNNNFWDGHLYPQILVLHDNNFSINEVETFLLETLSDDLKIFCQKYSINVKPITITNRTMNPIKKEIQTYVDSNIDVQNKIKEIYKEDWELYTNIKNSRNSF